MSYIDEGDGEAVVFLHGNPTWSFLWRNVITDLASEARCIAVDHVGFGASDKPRTPEYHTLERHILNLTALLRHLALERVTLVCHDWGGPIGLGWAIRNPERVAGLVLTATWGMRPEGLYRLPAWYRLLRSPGLGEIMVQKHNLAVERLLRFAYADPRHVQDATMKAYQAPFPFPDDRVAVLRFARMVPLRAGDESYEELGQIEAGLSKLDAPTRLVWGERDHLYPDAIAKRLVKLLPRATADSLTVAPRTGHLVPEEAPGEILRAIRDVMGR
jgi:cis-3-alkyl-4-acyloxetan-2-one decarboxylase